MIRKKVKRLLNKIVKITIISGMIIINCFGFSVKSFASDIKPFKLDKSSITYIEKQNKVLIQPGHMGKGTGLDPGAIAADGRFECDLNLKLAKEIGAILEQSGIKVEFTREGDVYQSLGEVKNIANNSDADYFLSVHFNSAEDNKAKGTEVYYNTAVYDNNGKVINKKIAEECSKNMSKALNTIDRGSKPSEFYNRNIKTKGCLIEGGFISNKDELKKIDDNFSNLAKSIANSIINGLK